MRTLSTITAAVVVLVTTSQSAHAGKWEDRLLQAALTGKDCNAKIKSYTAIARDAERAGVKTWAAIAYMNAASCSTTDSNATVAFAARAVKLGFADCVFFAVDKKLYSVLKSSPKGRALLARIKMSPADYAESMWQASEAQAIMHDTNMMITENVNRKDRNWTVVPQSRIPTRSTPSRYIRANRAVLRWLQKYQKVMVQRSDQSRISHLTNMTIINSGRGPSPQQVMMSARLALQRAQRRAAAVKARAFKGTRASTKPRACTRF
jgi:hypothetical protein